MIQPGVLRPPRTGLAAQPKRQARLPRLLPQGLAAAPGYPQEPPPPPPSSPVHALRPVFPRRTGIPAAPALVARAAAAVPAEGAAGAVHAVAAPLARRPPKPSLAFALARLLGAGREAAGAFEAAPPTPPARQAAAVAGEGVAVGAGGVALALLLAGGCPPARLAAAGAGEGVAAAVGAALAGELAEPSPVAGVAGAAPARRVAVPIGVARAAPLAVGAPVLLGTACEGKETGSTGGTGKPGSPPSIQAGKGDGEGWALGKYSRDLQSAPKKPGWQRQTPGFTHTSSAPQASSPSHSAVGGRVGTSAHDGPPGLAPRCRTTRPPRARAAFPGKPPSRFPLHPSGRAAAPSAACWVGAWGSPQYSTPSPLLEESRRASAQHPSPQRSHPAESRDRALGFIAIHHSPAVHSCPSCLQPGQHAGPVGSLRERRRGRQPGQGSRGRCGFIYSFTASVKAKRMWALAPAGPGGWGSSAVPGASLRKETNKIVGNLRGCSPSGRRGWAVGQARLALPLRSPGRVPDTLGAAQSFASEPEQGHQGGGKKGRCRRWRGQWEAKQQRSSGDVRSKSPFGFSPGGRWTFCHCPAPPRCPVHWGCLRNNPWRRALTAPSAHACPNHIPQHHPSLCAHAVSGCRSPSMEGQMDDDPLEQPRSPRRWRGMRGDPRGTYLQTFLPSGSSSWAELCTHSHSWRQRMGRALPIPAGHKGPSPCSSPDPRRRPSVPSVCPVPPVARPLPPSSLGFLPEEMWEEAPRSRRQGCGGEGEAGNATARAIFGPWCHPGSSNRRPGARRSHAGAGAWLHISPAAVPLPLRCPPSPPELFFPTSPQPTSGVRCLPLLWPPVSHPTALLAPSWGWEVGSPRPPRGHCVPQAALRTAAGHHPTSPAP